MKIRNKNSEGLTNRKQRRHPTVTPSEGTEASSSFGVIGAELETRYSTPVGLAPDAELDTLMAEVEGIMKETEALELLLENFGEK